MREHGVLKGFKYRIYPNEEQKVLIGKHIGCARFIYNWGLKTKSKAWASEKKNISRFSLNKMIVPLKKQPATAWLKEVNSQILQSASDDLDKAFISFFHKKSDYPTFKCKNKGKQSFRVPQFFELDQEQELLHLPKFTKPIKIVLSRKIKGQMLSVTISKTPTNKYFASVLVDTQSKPKPPKKINPKTTLGLDLGIKTYATDSNGNKYDNPKTLAKYAKRLAKAQRRASRKTKGSNNLKKANLRVALIHERITNTRNDFQHKLTHSLTHENQVGTIVIENLNVSGMMQNHKLAKSIGDCSWSEFIRKLSYKCDWYGINLIQIGRFEPSSKTCSVCGTINNSLTLKDREWTCSSCNTHHDRDINAAVNIKNIGLNPKQQEIRVEHSKLTLGESRRNKVTRPTQESPA